MRELPILFSSLMVRAIIDVCKKAPRRIVTSTGAEQDVKSP